MVRVLDKADVMLTLSSAIISGAIYHFLPFTNSIKVLKEKRYKGKENPESSHEST